MTRAEDFDVACHVAGLYFLFKAVLVERVLLVAACDRSTGILCALSLLLEQNARYADAVSEMGSPDLFVDVASHPYPDHPLGLPQV